MPNHPKKFSGLSTLIHLGLIIVVALSCVKVDVTEDCVKEGKRYGITKGLFQGRWYHYYERGLSFSEGHCWAIAERDLVKALEQRDDGDRRRARTYGMHFVDYFPHRELGIVYYRLKRYPEAIDELETSLGSVETAKAKFYINKVRKAVLEQTRRDMVPPHIVLDSPAEGLLTNRFAVQVSGHAADDTYVSRVAINGRALFIELAEPHIPFAQEVSLRDGKNLIEVAVTDLLGRSTKQQFTVHVDRQGPLISLDRVDVRGASSQRQARIKGFVSDRSAIVRFSLAGRRVPLHPGTEWEFHEEVPLTAGMAFLPFEVEDAAGNITKGQFPLSPTAGKPPAIKQGKLTTPLGPHLTFIRPLTMVTDPVAFRSAAIKTVQLSDQTPPRIKLSELAAKQTVYADTLYLEGQVTSHSAINAFSINGESIWRRPTRQMYFGHFVLLKPGDNNFELVARDEDGHVAREEILVTYAISEIKRLSSRLSVGLFPFEKEGETSALGETVYDSLYNALVNQKRFRLVERAQLDKILQELKLSQTELVNPATTAKIGKIVAAESILVGKVTETPQDLEVFARFDDVETAVTLAAVDVYGEDLKLRALNTLMEGLAWKLQRRIPIVEGKIWEIEGKSISIDLNREHAIQEQTKLILYREGKEVKDPDTGKIRKKPAKRLGEARVTAVGDIDELSEATLLQPEIVDKLKMSDKVVTK